MIVITETTRRFNFRKLIRGFSKQCVSSDIQALANHVPRASWPRLRRPWQRRSDPSQRAGPLPLRAAGAPWWMFPRRIGNETKFFFLFSFFLFFFFVRQAFPWAIFPGRPHYYSTETSAPSEPDGWSFLKAKGRGKEKKKGGKKKAGDTPVETGRQ